MTCSEAVSILTIAGTDPSGGAGIQADLKTFAAFECYGTSVVTALVAQNTTGVQGVHPCPPEFITQQIESVLSDIDIKAIKTGMLYDAANVMAVVSALKSHFKDDLPTLVCDPVCVSTSGHSLLLPEAVKVMIEKVFPLATVITPNKAEAELILSTVSCDRFTINTIPDMVSAAQMLIALGPKAVLLKGGHMIASIASIEAICQSRPEITVVREGLSKENTEILGVGKPWAEEDLVVDVLYQADTITLYVRPRIESTSTHGTGCTLSAALACALAKGLSVSEATQIATSYTHRAIETAQAIGHGHGPLNHLHSTVQRTIPLPTNSNQHPFTSMLIRSSGQIWKDYVEHEFVVRLGNTTLPKENFIHFIKQDYHYLKYYARAYGQVRPTTSSCLSSLIHRLIHSLMCAKSTSFSALQSSASIIQHIARESQLHKSFCSTWGVTSEDLENTVESPATMAYGAYLIDAGVKGDAAHLLIALSACLLGYGEVGLWLKKQPPSSVILEGNPYLQWIEDYSGEEYQNAVKTGLASLESLAINDPPSPVRLVEWKTVWKRCTELEKNFWDMAMNLS